MDLNAYLEEIGDWFLTIGPKLLLVVIATLLIIKGIGVLTSKLAERFSSKLDDEEAKKRASTLSSVIHHLLVVVVIIVAVITVMGQLGIEIGPVLAAAGIVGLAVGFGAQNLVKDVINGFFILLENQIRVGDVVQIAGKSGLVEKVNLKMTVLRDLHGTVHFIPNGNIDMVSNMTMDFSRYVFDIGVAYREDVDEVIEVLKEVDEELRNDPDFMENILEPIEVLGLDKFDDSAVVIRARTKTKPIKQWEVGREFNRRLKKKFDERDIEIPFPHVTLYMGKNKDDTAPPMFVSMKTEEQSTAES